MSGQLKNTSMLESLVQITERSVEDAALDRARLHVLDWIGCCIAGSQTATGRAFAAAFNGGAVGEAFYWGSLGNILEMDDVDKRALLHPGPSIIPAVLSLAAKRNCTLREMLQAVVRGYEATIRLGRAVGWHHYSIWHNTGTCGPIGAAAACSSILKLNSGQSAHALAHAISLSAGLWQTRHEPPSMGKQLHTANAARIGVEAAQLAKAGVVGPLSIIEGEQGFFKAMCKDGTPEEVLAEYDANWLINEVSFKPWPACRHAHATIDAALELKKTIDTDKLPDEIIVRSYSDALKFCDKPNPKTVIEAKFSLQHAVAVCWVKEKPELADFELDALERQEFKVVRDRVRVEDSDKYNSVFPAHFGAEIETAGQKVVINDALGDPENPVSNEQLSEKAKSLIEYSGVDRSQASQFVSYFLQCDESLSCQNIVAHMNEVMP